MLSTNMLSMQSKKNARIGAVKAARKQGMIAAYLNVAAIVAALVAVCLVMGLVLGLYGPVYAREQYYIRMGGSYSHNHCGFCYTAYGNTRYCTLIFLIVVCIYYMYGIGTEYVHALPFLILIMVKFWLLVAYTLISIFLCSFTLNFTIVHGHSLLS